MVELVYFEQYANVRKTQNIELTSKRPNINCCVYWGELTKLEKTAAVSHLATNELERWKTMG